MGSRRYQHHSGSFDGQIKVQVCEANRMMRYPMSVRNFSK